MEKKILKPGTTVYSLVHKNPKKGVDHNGLKWDLLVECQIIKSETIYSVEQDIYGNEFKKKNYRYHILIKEGGDFLKGFVIITGDGFIYESKEDFIRQVVGMSAAFDAYMQDAKIILRN